MSRLRFGYVCELYYRYADEPMPKQLDLLAEWFGDLLIHEEETDGKKKITPWFDENELMIHAARYNGRLYAGGDTTITQLAGRLIGTADGNREKQRKNAVLIQKKIVRTLAESDAQVAKLQLNVLNHLAALSDEGFVAFADNLIDFINAEAIERDELTPSQRDREAFPFDDEIFDNVIYNAAYQYCRYKFEGLINSYLWLLLGSLLRNEAGRMTRRFDSGFNEVNRAPGEENSLLSKLHYLYYPEEYEYVYEGDDTESKFPDFYWYCDRCDDLLNDQEGFDDHLETWTCKRCGKVNQIDGAHAYECREDAILGINPMDEDKLNAAIEERKKQLEQNDG